jgi:undecaprenyl-diphosphatase
MVNAFDQSILSALNSYAGKSWVFDHTLDFISGSYLLKGFLFVCIVWAYWFRAGDAAAVRNTRDHLVCTIAAGVFAIAFARMLALLLPFRVRPRFNPDVHFWVPADWNLGGLINWSSFPSDHAVLFAALATGFVFISRPLGMAVLAYGCLFIDLPRIYFGLHYPTDVLAGMVVGVGIGYWFNCGPIRRLICPTSQRLEASAPHLFYPALFLISVQIATLFDDVRRAASMLREAARHFWFT